MSGKFYPPWRNENANRRYPFSDTATMLSTDGSFEIPDSLFVDAAISARGASLPIYLSDISVVGRTARVSLRDSSGVEVGTGETEMGTDLDVMKFTDSSGRWVATFTFGPNSNYDLFSHGDGAFVFVEGATDIVISAVLNLPVDKGLLSFTNAFGVSAVYGDVYMVGEYGVQLETSQEAEVQPDGTITSVILIRAHAVGDPQFIQRSCDDASRRISRPITELVFQYGSSTHSCKPDADGNIVIVATTAATTESALQAVPIDTGLSINLPGKRL